MALSNEDNLKFEKLANSFLHEDAKEPDGRSSTRAKAPKGTDAFIPVAHVIIGLRWAYLLGIICWLGGFLLGKTSILQTGVWLLVAVLVFEIISPAAYSRKRKIR